MRASPLKEPTVFADKILSQICGVPEGTHLSYVELTKSLHSYIKTHGLRIQIPNPEPEPEGKPTEATPTKALESQEVGIRGAPHGATLRQPHVEETGGRQLPLDNFCGANTGTALGPILAPSDTPQEETLKWPRRCADCFDRLSDRAFAEKHFIGFHKVRDWQLTSTSSSRKQRRYAR